MHSSPFIDRLLARAQTTKKKVILAEGEDPRTIDAAIMLIASGAVAEVILVGRPKQITSVLGVEGKRHLGRSLLISDVEDQRLVEACSAHFGARTRARGKQADEAQLQAAGCNPLIHAGVLLAKGRGDCALAGACTTTADVIRAALASVGLRPGIKTVSGSFFLDRSTRDHEHTIFFADAGVVIEPTLEQLVDIAAASVETWRCIMNDEPVVAFLSFSTKGSAAHQASAKMAAAAVAFRERHPSIKADGELQFDAAVVPTVSAKKAPQSVVAGRANIFIFPDLNSGNISYKIAQRLGGFSAYGPILQGLASPYSDLSRGATAEDIAVSALINCLR